MSCLFLLKGNSAEGGDVPWLDVSMAGSTGDGDKRPEAARHQGMGTAVLSELAVLGRPFPSPLAQARK